MQNFAIEHSGLLWVGDWQLQKDVALAKADFCRLLICFRGTDIKLWVEGAFTGELDGEAPHTATEYEVENGEHTLFITATAGFRLRGISTQALLDVKAYYGQKMAEEYAQIQAGREPKTCLNWQPVDFKATFPTGGVELKGLFKEMLERNVARIKNAFASPWFVQDQHTFWQFWLPASVEGRLIGGAAKALQWQEDAELRRIIDVLVDKISWQMREDGYYNYYREKESFALNDTQNSERKNYDRTHWTYGMLAAHRTGNPKALKLVRRMYDWLEGSGWGKDLLLGGNSTNALMGSLYMAESEQGRPEDLQFNQRFLDQHFWEEMLKKQNPAAFSHYPGERPHCYDLLELLSLAYEYRLTGDLAYKEALLGGWKVYKKYYKHLGGATAICEEQGPYPPGSYYLTRGHNGETCGSVFWIWVNEQLQQLYPDDPRFAAEIEENLLNILPDVLTVSGNTRYHNRLQGIKDVGGKESTCCEVMTSFILSDLPKYLYTQSRQGIWINQYLSAKVQSATLCFDLQADLWDAHKATLCIRSAVPHKQFIKLRIPDWSAAVEVVLNGRKIRVKDKEFVAVSRIWQAGDQIEIIFSPRLRCVRYTGAEQSDDGAPRYALVYGPYLLACVDYEGEDIPRLQARADELHWQKNGQVIKLISHPQLRFIPYYTVADGQRFCCYPVFAE